MKKYIYAVVALLLVSACSKKSEVKPVDTQKITIKDAGDIQFKTIPLANDQLKLTFLKYPDMVLAKVIMKQDTTTLASQPVTYNIDGSVSATFNYAFQTGKTYNFKVQTTSVSNSVNQYSITGYIHNYVSRYSYQKVLGLHQSLGPNGFDISPSRNYMFVQDDINNVVQTKRISLQNLSVEDVKHNTFTDPIRAVSDNELLVFGDNATENVPQTPDPGTDAIVLAKYSMTTGKSVFVDYVSSGYGRVSRIVNNHVLVTNPIFTAKTASLINLADLSKVKYSLGNLDFRYINELSFGHILYYNMLVNTGTGALSPVLDLDGNSALMDVDDSSGYSFVQSINNTASSITTAFSVYKGNTPVYQSGYAFGREVFFPVIYNIQNDVLIYYKYFEYDTKVNIDGYYTLNIKTGESKLIQADSNPYVRSDYQLKNGAIFSVMADGVYKLTPR
jgi:hypothetical protein